MKGIRRILIWILVSLMIQIPVYLYLDKVRYVDQKTFAVENVDVGKKTNTNVTFDIPEDAKDINVSYDGRYVAYFQGGDLKVFDTTNGTIKKQAVKEGSVIAYYKWLPDEERMFIAEKDTNRQLIDFFSYDVKKDDKNPIVKKDIPVTIYLPDSNSQVDDIEISNLTNVIFVKITSVGKRSSVYSIDINNTLQKVSLISHSIGKVQAINRKDILVYEDMSTSKEPKIRLANTSQSLNLDASKNYNLLSVDSDDTVYLGEEDNGLITKIYSGQLDEDITKWKITDLNEPIDEDELFISNEGKVYYNDNLKGVVTELDTGKETPYTGEFYQMFNNGIATINDGKLQKFYFN